MLSRRGLSFRFPEVKASIVILISVCLTKISSQSAASLSPHQFECHYNYAVLSEKTGDLQVCLIMSSLPLFLLLPRTVVITLSIGLNLSQLTCWSVVSHHPLPQTSYMLVQQSLASFPSHADSKDLLAQLSTHFQTL